MRWNMNNRFWNKNVDGVVCAPPPPIQIMDPPLIVDLWIKRNKIIHELSLAVIILDFTVFVCSCFVKNLIC